MLTSYSKVGVWRCSTLAGETSPVPIAGWLAMLISHSFQEVSTEARELDNEWVFRFHVLREVNSTTNHVTVFEFSDNI